MKHALLLALVALWHVSGSGSASDGATPPASRPVCVAVQIGFNTMARTADSLANPFGTLPAPVGAGLEVIATRHLDWISGRPPAAPGVTSWSVSREWAIM